MDRNALLSGESETIDYKKERPKDILDGAGRSLDSSALKERALSGEEVEAFCARLTDYAQIRQQDGEKKGDLRPLTKNQLLAWGLLVEEKGLLYPTYAYLLFEGKPFLQVFSGIQCAVFRGTNRAVFVDRKFYDGPLYQQIEEAYRFVLRSIRLGAEIKGLFRQDLYEFPIGTIREAITNALCHRSYLQPAYVQLALYDDRLEITSPGMLLRGLSLERIKEGYSKIRNRGIAQVFRYLGLLEGWGSGIPRMFQECKAYGLPEPELLAQDGDFRILFPRKSLYGEPSRSAWPQGVRESPVELTLGSSQTLPLSNRVDLSVQEEKILGLIQEKEQVTSEDVGKLLGVKARRARVLLRSLVEKGYLRKIGVTVGSYYVLD